MLKSVFKLTSVTQCRTNRPYLLSADYKTFCSDFSGSQFNFVCDFDHIQSVLRNTSLQHYMKKNMGSIDRIIRVIIAATLIGLYFQGILTGATGIILVVLSIIFVLTSLIGSCPLYVPFGLSSLRKPENIPHKFK
jgi:hypothetical protein